MKRIAVLIVELDTDDKDEDFYVAQLSQGKIFGAEGVILDTTLEDFVEDLKKRKDFNREV